MKKFFAVLGMLLFAAPLFAQDQNAATAAAPADTTAAAAAPADSAAPAKKAKMAKSAGGDEEGIKKMFDAFAQSWNSADIPGMVSNFTDDSTIINPMGMEGHGLAGVKKVLTGDFANGMKGTQQSYDDYNFVWVMSNMALVDTNATVTGMKKPDGTDMGPTKVHVYGVVVNRGGKGWKARSIRAYSYLMPPSAMDAAAPPAADDSAAPMKEKAAPAKADDSKPDATK